MTLARPPLTWRGPPIELAVSSLMKKTEPLGAAPAGASAPVRVAVSVTSRPATAGLALASIAIDVVTASIQSIRTSPLRASELPSVTSRAEASQAELPAPPPPAESAQLPPVHSWPAPPPRTPPPPPPPVPFALFVVPSA